MYDYIIIGTGPAGLCLAWYLSKMNKKILLIDRENSIGGCHRVRRVNGLFTEHGPRIYFSNYLNTKKWFNDMDINFDDMFNVYKFLNIAYEFGFRFSLKEFFDIIISYLQYSISFDHPNNIFKKISVMDFMIKHNFSEKTKDYFDRLCRLMDGASSERYTLYEFFSTINQCSLYNGLQVKRPTDLGMFKYIYEKMLMIENIDIMLNTNVIKINKYNDKIVSIMINRNGRIIEINAEKYIFAIPPKPFYQILQNSHLQNDFNISKEFIKESEYITYIPVTYHWNRKINLKKIWGFPIGEWGIGFIVMSDYTKFDNPLSQTVISAAITIIDGYSSYLKKTPNQCTIEELKQEIFRQLQLVFGDLPKPTISILSPGVYYDDNRWKTKDSAFVFTKYGYQVKTKYQNVYNVGTQNGNSKYCFTSMESAVTNAIVLLNQLEPDKIKLRIREPFTINRLIFILIIVVIILLMVIKFF